jgi:hypothetical protein
MCVSAVREKDEGWVAPPQLVRGSPPALVHHIQIRVLLSLSLPVYNDNTHNKKMCRKLKVKSNQILASKEEVEVE